MFYIISLYWQQHWHSLLVIFSVFHFVVFRLFSIFVPLTAIFLLMNIMIPYFVISCVQLKCTDQKIFVHMFQYVEFICVFSTCLCFLMSNILRFLFLCLFPLPGPQCQPYGNTIDSDWSSPKQKIQHTVHTKFVTAAF
jgi:hypothetical protein